MLVLLWPSYCVFISDVCVYGDYRGFDLDRRNLNCSLVASVAPYECYKKQIEDDCCETCLGIQEPVPGKYGVINVSLQQLLLTCRRPSDYNRGLTYDTNLSWRFGPHSSTPSWQWLIHVGDDNTVTLGPLWNRSWLVYFIAYCLRLGLFWWRIFYYELAIDVSYAKHQLVD